MSPNIDPIDAQVLTNMTAIASAGQEDLDFSVLFKKGKQTPMHQKNFKWRSQRQIRKNRRRAHAAGAKDAFRK